MQGSLDRSGELTQVFSAENQNNTKLRGKYQKEADRKKNDFLNELIKFVLMDEEGRIVPGCEWLISRKKVTMKTLRDLIKKSPMPKVEPDYFYDNGGTPYWMDDLMMTAMPIPCYYIIIPQVKRTAFDIRTDPKYEGQTSFTILNVPLKAKDEMTLVDEAVIREWILYGVLEEDLFYQSSIVDIAKTKGVLKEIDKRVKSVSKMEFVNPDGSKMKNEEAEIERATLYKAFSEERLVAEERLTTKELYLKMHISWRRMMEIDLQVGHVDDNTSTATWFVRLHGIADAAAVEDSLIKKDDWPGIRVACGSSEPKLPIWVGRNAMPVGKKSAYEPDYTLLQVNVAGARFLRLPHGIGTWKQLDDRKSSNISAEKFELFYGVWEAGKKFGHGLEFNDAGVYYGRFIDGWRSGHGKLDLGCGTTIFGNFGVNISQEEKPSALFDNPYREGVPNGQVDILFGDGGLFRGLMKNGKIQGPGEYQSALGELVIGQFENGILHGRNGYIKTLGDEKFKGDFIEGEITGLGVYENHKGDKFEGFFEDGLRNGRGVAKFHNKGFYRGYYVNGYKTGKGELGFGKIKKKKIINTVEKDIGNKSKPEEVVDIKVEETGRTIRILDPEFRFVYQGYFLSNSVTSGGILMNNVTRLPIIVSRRDKRALYPIDKMMRREERVNREIKNKTEKYADMEHHIRKEMTKKKFVIFQQQKHFTKKSMYADDTYEGVGGIHKDDIKSRAFVRSNRLDRASEDMYVSKKALVPHLRALDKSTESGITQVFNLIQPDLENRDTKRIKRLLPRLAISDFEEIRERQRLLKYDLIWERAETAYNNKKKGVIN